MKDLPTEPGSASAPEGAATEDYVQVARPAHKDPDYIGPYRILERIGEGGMGIVYKAEQRGLVRRTVALKVIKLGMDTKEMVARFEVERQALALMGHPNVAKVFEAGMTESGRPFFAMEYVAGVPLTQYCDEARLNTRERLELYIHVCHAVQHAHQKGIIHRDLKPSNILVQLFDGKPVPKVIDFGIAKATNAALTQQTLFTSTGALIGTPEYMSPEQAMTSGLDVDTRADIYSLGVILYELLTGLLPFDALMLRSGSVQDMACIIKETEPHKPSTRLSDSKNDESKRQSGGTVADIAKRHRTEPRTLRRELRGDLDWIILKAIEKERTRRYETANDLAMDLQRHLYDEPVLARPPSTVYRLGKFARKHQGAAVAAGLVLFALLLGVIATGVALVKAKRSESGARTAEGTARIAESDAKEQAVKAQTVSRFLEDLLASAQPGAEGGRTAKVVDLLDRADAQMSAKLRDQPDAEIAARVTLGKTYSALLLYPAAERNYRRAYELAEATSGTEAERTLAIAADLSLTITQSGGDATESRNLAEHTLAVAQRTLGDHHRVSYSAASSLGSALIKLGKRDQAMTVARRLVQDARAHSKVISPDEFARYLSNFSDAINSANSSRDPQLTRESENCLREVVQIAKSGVKISPITLALARSSLAGMLRTQGRIPEAVDVWRETLADARSTMGESHKITRDLISAAATGLELMQQYEDAIPIRRETLAFAQEAQPPDQENIARIKNRLSTELVHMGEFKEALALKSESVAARQKLFSIFDREARGNWRMGEVLKLSVNERWTSQALRAQACEGLFQLMETHATWPMPADHLMCNELRFKLFRWEGEAAGKEKALSPVAQGTLTDLRALAEPALGIYLLWLEVPRSDAPPLHHAEWIYFAPWQLSFYKIVQSPENDAAAWEEMLKTTPVKQGTIQSLALDDYLRFNNDLPPRLTLFGSVATSTMDFPAGQYSVLTRGGTKHRWSMGGVPMVRAWQLEGTIAIQKKSGAVQFRVEHFQTWGQNFFLWLRLRPVGAVADEAFASLIDPREAINQALVKFGDDVQFARDPTRLFLRASMLFSAGKFRESAADFKLLTELNPDDYWSWHRRGCLLAYLGDTAEYRIHCQAMFEKFRDTQDHNAAELLAKTSVLLPDIGMNLEQLNKRVEWALGPGRSERFLNRYQMAKGMVEYRLAHYDKAADWLGKSTQGLTGASYLNARCYLAMSRQHLGQKAGAREIYDLAVQQLQLDAPRVGNDLLDSGDIENWLIAQTTFREAKVLFAQ
jgi:serine/threonine protein kinase/tetratricopeptide (TPR) repeat protein